MKNILLLLLLVNISYCWSQTIDCQRVVCISPACEPCPLPPVGGLDYIEDGTFVNNCGYTCTQYKSIQPPEKNQQTGGCKCPDSWLAPKFCEQQDKETFIEDAAYTCPDGTVIPCQQEICKEKLINNNNNECKPSCFSDDPSTLSCKNGTELIEPSETDICSGEPCTKYKCKEAVCVYNINQLADKRATSNSFYNLAKQEGMSTEKNTSTSGKTAYTGISSGLMDYLNTLAETLKITGSENTQLNSGLNFLENSEGYIFANNKKLFNTFSYLYNQTTNYNKSTNQGGGNFYFNDKGQTVSSPDGASICGGLIYFEN